MTVTQRFHEIRLPILFIPISATVEAWENCPRDPNQLAKAIVDIATGQVEDTISPKKRKPSRRRAGGLKGGVSRAKLLSSQEKKAIAEKIKQRRRNFEMKFFERLRDQPAPSTLETIVVFFALDIPLYVGKGIALFLLGFPEWAAFGVGLIVMAASCIAYIAIRREVLSK